MPARAVLATIATLTAGSPLAAHAQTSVQAAPATSPPLVDGRLTAAEWPAAGGAGIQLHATHHGGALFLGWRTGAVHVVSLCVLSGDTIRVLHASQALGSVRYVPDSGGHRGEGAFAWELRSGTTGAARAKYLADHGWFASTVDAGNPGELEFQIVLPAAAREVRIAAGIMVADASVVGWPEGLTDGCADQQLVSGEVPHRLRFRTMDWATVRLEGL